MHSKTQRNAPARGAILLAAGQGSRMRPLTEQRPKCMLKVGDGTIIGSILDPILTCGPREIVIVTGFEYQQLNAFIQSKYVDHDIRLVYNDRYLEDTNILSTQVGVEALKHPERGYFIIETDILALANVWIKIINQESELGSFWVTKGRYHANLTGGIVNVGHDGQVIDIRYEPKYNSLFHHWWKMLGVLSVAPEQVLEDRRTRSAMVRQSTSHYYMQPWIENASDLPCQIYDLEDDFAASFNTKEAYEAEKRIYLELCRSQNPNGN